MEPPSDCDFLIVAGASVVDGYETRLVGCEEWMEFDGSCVCQKVLVAYFESHQRRARSAVFVADSSFSAALRLVIDVNRAGDKIDGVSENQATRKASRYDALIATLVGIFALCISCYTAYMQRQQVRAMVWPILEFDSSNDPNIHLSLANKGVGPAIIRHVAVKVDDQPVTNWSEVFAKLVETGKPAYAESDMSGRVLSPGESMTIFTPHDPDNKPIVYDKSNPLYVQMNKDRERITVEICYSSTLGDCWILHGGGKTANVTTSVGRCPEPSGTSFQQ